MVIKRRTLIYFFVVLVVFIITCFIFAYEMKEIAPPDLGIVDYDSKEPNLDLNWENFYRKFSHRSSNRERYYNEVFIRDYKYKVIKWEGKVLRVDSFD